uniref:Putative u3 snornp-associated protein n=1 Tax=Ixodes ricinus TaxID=34613 RepID=A0A0K8RFZ6_IXORI
MSFFIRNSKGNASVTQQRSKDRKKRKGTQPANRNDAKKAAGGRGAKANSKASEEILSSESDIEDRVVPGTHFSDDDEELETEQEKKLRLAKKYLAEIEKQEKERLEVEELDRSVLSHRLRNELLEQSGQLQKKVADKVEGVKDSEIKILRGHKLSVTCVTISHDEKHIFSGSKDCSIIKWCTRTGAKLQPGARCQESCHIGSGDAVSTYWSCAGTGSFLGWLFPGIRLPEQGGLHLEPSDHEPTSYLPRPQRFHHGSGVSSGISPAVQLLN